jgi:hypothetical protein
MNSAIRPGRLAGRHKAQNEFMAFIVCARGGERLTAAITEIPRPAPAAEETRGTREFLPARMTSGTYAVGPEVNGFVLNPDDVKGTELHPEPHRGGGCCGLDGLNGPNLVCARCGAEIGTKESDCWTQQQVVMLPKAVKLIAGNWPRRS